MMTLLDPRGGQYTLLITDDDEACRDSLKRVFEPEGYTTYLASCGKEAVKIARMVEVDLLILDVHLPDYSGLETFQIIKQEIRIGLPCIFMSGEITRGLQIDLISANAYTIIPKPININILRDSVERVIEKYYWK